jgi:hypothetical protein
VDGQARKRVRDFEEKNRQQTRKYSLLQKEAADLREANKGQKEEIGAIGCAQTKSDKEMSEFRAPFAREQEVMTREIAALGRQLGEEAAARGKFAQEFGSLTKTKHAGKPELTETEPRASTVPQTQFPFTSDQPEQGRIPAGGVIAHLAAAMCRTHVSSKSPRAALPVPVAPLGTPPTPGQSRFSSRRTSRAGRFAVTSTIRILWERLPCNANLETGD